LRSVSEVEAVRELRKWLGRRKKGLWLPSPVQPHLPEVLLPEINPLDPRGISCRSAAEHKYALVKMDMV